MSPSLLGAFAIACFLSCATPGVAVGLVISQSLRHSFRASLWGITGLQAVTLLKYGLAGLGLMELLALSPRLFGALRVAGALYLIWVGLRMLLSRGGAQPGMAEGKTEPELEPGAAFWQGVVTQFCNAYGIVFYVSLVPQFLETGKPLWPQIAILLAATIAIDTVVLGIYAGGASTLARCLAREHGARLLNVLSGLAMLGVGLKIAVK